MSAVDEKACRIGLCALCSQKWHVVLLAVLEDLPTYAKIMSDFTNYRPDFRNYAHKMT